MCVWESCSQTSSLIALDLLLGCEQAYTLYSGIPFLTLETLEGMGEKPMTETSGTQSHEVAC